MSRRTRFCNVPRGNSSPGSSAGLPPTGGPWFPLAQPRPLPPRCELGAAGSPPVLCTLPPTPLYPGAAHPQGGLAGAGPPWGSVPSPAALPYAILVSSPSHKARREQKLAAAPLPDSLWHGKASVGGRAGIATPTAPVQSHKREEQIATGTEKRGVRRTARCGCPPPVPKPTKASCQLTQTSPGAVLRCQRSQPTSPNSFPGSPAFPVVLDTR